MDNLNNVIKRSLSLPKAGTETFFLWGPRSSGLGICRDARQRRAVLETRDRVRTNAVSVIRARVNQARGLSQEA